MDEKVKIKVCCNNMVAAIKTDDIIINGCEFCLGNSKYKLKEPTKEYSVVIVKIEFCPWCGMRLSKISDEMKQKMFGG
jgi:hypothetical protein